MNLAFPVGLNYTGETSYVRRSYSTRFYLVSRFYSDLFHWRFYPFLLDMKGGALLYLLDFFIEMQGATRK